jgi:hypothetical protein
MDRDAYIRYQTHGTERPDALRVMSNLATDLELLGRVGEARTMQAQAVDAYRRVLGDRHKETLQARVRLDVLSRRFGADKDLATDSVAR